MDRPYVCMVGDMGSKSKMPVERVESEGKMQS